MLTEAKKELKFIFLSIKYNLAREMTNKVAFLTNIIFMILNNAAFLIEWIIFFSIKDNIGGYYLKDVILLWALASGTYAICFIFFGAVQELPNLIMNGKIDSFLVQPKNVLLSILVSKTKISAIGDLMYSYILLFIYGISIKNFLLFTLFIITGGIIVTAIAVIFGSLAFYITKADTITGNIMGTMLNFGTYPDSIFKGAIRLLFYTIIPIGFSIYMPLYILKDFNIISFIIVISYTVLIVLLGFLIFYKGLKKYSSGNLMSARV
ncbi:MAG: ABC-2 family transporter protein [Bacilli bacterium]|nr:ABC-2 family transporter protein [Bacilli bacterium]